MQPQAFFDVRFHLSGTLNQTLGSHTLHMLSEFFSRFSPQNQVSETTNTDKFQLNHLSISQENVKRFLGLPTTGTHIQTSKTSNVVILGQLDIYLVFSWVSEVFWLTLFFILPTLVGLNRDKPKHYVWNFKVLMFECLCLSIAGLNQIPSFHYFYTAL
jgi:hypothetical protein